MKGHLVQLSTPLVLALACSAGSVALAGPAEISVSVLANLVEGPAPAVCEIWDRFQPPGRREWWASVGDVRPNTGSGWMRAGGSIACGESSRVEQGGEARESPANPYLTARGTFTATLVRQVEDEILVVIDVSLSARRLSAFEASGEPVYGETAIERRVYVSESREAFIPLLVASATETEAIGIHEVFLRINVALDRADGRYGTIVILAEPEERELLLDGGVAGKASAGAETKLENVSADWHEIGVRDKSGRELRDVVFVPANRTVVVKLKPDGGTGEVVPFRLTPLGRNDRGFEEYRREADGAVVVKIPAGEFLMGNKETERSPLEHTVYLSEFLMDKTGVTWGQYKAFAQATGLPLPPHEPYWGIHHDHPAVFVTWEEAKAYCEWAGGRLPTEAEREKAARGTDGRKYPWGDEPPTPERAVFRRSWGHEATDPVGIRPKGASPYGLLDMGGNVWEWCSDWYDDDYYALSPRKDPKGPTSGIAHVVRGGSWDSRPSVLSASCRNWGHRGYRDGDFGFRCAMSPTP